MYQRSDYFSPPPLLPLFHWITLYGFYRFPHATLVPYILNKGGRVNQIISFSQNPSMHPHFYLNPKSLQKPARPTHTGLPLLLWINLFLFLPHSLCSSHKGLLPCAWWMCSQLRAFTLSFPFALYTVPQNIYMLTLLPHLYSTVTCAVRPSLNTMFKIATLPAPYKPGNPNLLYPALISPHTTF